MSKSIYVKDLLMGNMKILMKKALAEPTWSPFLVPLESQVY